MSYELVITRKDLIVIRKYLVIIRLERFHTEAVASAVLFQDLGF